MTEIDKLDYHLKKCLFEKPNSPKRKYNGGGNTIIPKARRLITSMDYKDKSNYSPGPGFYEIGSSFDRHATIDK